MSIDAMKTALEALEEVNECGYVTKCADAFSPEITALRQAIEQAEKQEPVAWLRAPYGTIEPNPLYKISAPQSLEWEIPLYAFATPPQRQPLTEEEIYELVPDPVPVVAVRYLQTFARAVERAHGIGENK